MELPKENKALTPSQTKRRFIFPRLGVAVEADSVEEAQSKAEEKANQES